MKSERSPFTQQGMPVEQEPSSEESLSRPIERGISTDPHTKKEAARVLDEIEEQAQKLARGWREEESGEKAQENLTEVPLTHELIGKKIIDFITSKGFKVQPEGIVGGGYLHLGIYENPTTFRLPTRWQKFRARIYGPALDDPRRSSKIATISYDAHRRRIFEIQVLGRRNFQKLEAVALHVRDAFGIYSTIALSSESPEPGPILADTPKKDHWSS